MENLACTVYITIYFFGDKLKKKIAVYPRDKKKTKKVDKKSPKNEKDIKKLTKSIFNILEILEDFKKRIILEELSFYLKEGTGNAFNTAILYGLIWNLFGMFQAIIMNSFTVRNKDIKIETDFKEKVWNLNFSCIISIKIVNIILMCKQLLIIYLKNRKGGEADVRPSNRRSNDYSNAKY
ncbi:DUF2953 domain-containing protein [Ruminiclostridium herbifermentans]|uniref:DUF2953 domain-containing protein n=1 Tax=Ruminiclostridium herbifermentans TaxID=2488810 RepID=A0A7H1VIW7_9FIRM|nr:DUF2953 domain-containing protein [Ruminiclostridium herbifermentans]QNU65329.1 DUF2953 domain-containing protein [Ruminiclostridium herbifermentans]